MSETIKPRRSVLYMPGANPRALEKARTLDADALILDLEDAVAPDQKVAARDNVAAALSQGGYGHRELIVRINGLSSPWGRDDLRAAASMPIDGVLLPKVESAEDVIAAANLLAEYGAVGMAIWVMIETPLGVLHAQQIAQSCERLTVMVMGTNDLAKELRIEQTLDRAGFMTSLGLCVLAARANGLDIIDGVYIQLDDDEGLKFSCEQGRALGFDGKTLIHPKQLTTCNTVFAPDEEALARAQRIVEAWDQLQDQGGGGVLVVDGRLVEELHVVEAQRMMAMAEQIARRHQAEAR